MSKSSDGTYAVVFRAVGRAFQPAKDLFVEQICVNQLTAAKEVVLHIFDDILYLTFALGVGFATEHGLKSMFTDKGAETSGKHQVTKVLVDKKHLVLIINYFSGYSPEKLEGQLMGINRKSGRKRCTAKVDKLIPAAAQAHRKEIHF